MAQIHCKMCGGLVELPEGTTVGDCPYCGSRTTFPKVDSEKREQLYARAEQFRADGRFDRAISVYEEILRDDADDAEAYWGLLLSRLGIEYVEDPQTHERIPTCHRVQMESVLADGDYRSALEYADSGQREIYEAEARRIAEIQKGILAISAQEKPFDVFICYKETTDGGTRTRDSVVAQDIYYQLVNAGYKVFFSRITLEGKLGQQYEPYIFAALNSAKVMLVIGSKREYFNAAWVRNEWSRYLSLMKADRSRMLIPCYRDMDPYDIPEELSMLQSQDMSKIGFVQDLLRGVQKVVDASRTRQAPVVKPAEANPSAPKERPLGYVCTKCGKWYEGEIRFCADCGGAVEKEQPKLYFCLGCGKSYTSPLRFCTDCGKQVLEEKEYLKQKQLEVERLEQQDREREIARERAIFDEQMARWNGGNLLETDYPEIIETLRGLKEIPEATEEADKAEKMYFNIRYRQAMDKLNSLQGNHTVSDDVAGAWKKLADEFTCLSKTIPEATDHAERCRLRSQEIAKKAAERDGQVVLGCLLGIIILVGTICLLNSIFKNIAEKRFVRELKSFSEKIQLPGNVSLEMLFVPAGSFVMGSPSSEPDRGNGEVQHKVTISKPFCLGKYEVTQAQWQAVMGNNPSRFKNGENHPVESVSWEDARQFCDRLNNNSALKKPVGYRFDLPTEAQWEYACRGGNQSRNFLYSGNNALGNVAWYDEDWDSGKTHPVGQKSPNKLGFYDMSGNVWEWCRDWYGEYPAKHVTDPKGPWSGSCRVYRGGGWLSSARDCRSANRGSCNPSRRDCPLGFRLALVPVQ